MDTQVFMPCLIMVGSIILFGAIFGLSVLVRRRSAERRRQGAIELGFKPADRIDQQVFERMMALYRLASSGSIVWRAGFVRPAPEYDLYLLDLEARGEESNSHLGQTDVVISAHSLHLPRMLILPQRALEGRFADSIRSFTDSFIEKLYARGRGLNLIDFPAWPDFAARFIILADDETRTRQILSASLIEQLLRLEHYAVLGIDES